MPPKDRPMLFDEDIRLLLFDYLDLNYPKVRTFEEKIMGRSRSDVVVLLPDAIVGVEIKSDADTYTRLATQVRDYEKYFDMNYILVGSSHVRHVSEHVPPHWGILYVDQTEEEPIIREYRQSHQGTADIQNQLVFMWKRELRQLLDINGIPPSYAERGRKAMEKVLLKRVGKRKLKLQMCDILFERDYSVFEEEKN